MDVLFINSKKFDYSQDITYAGLADVLGKSHVKDWPLHPSYHFNLRKYPKNMGLTHGAVTDLIASRRINPKRCDVVILAALKPDALENYLKILDQVPASTPVVLIDGGDVEEIGGDATRLGCGNLWNEIIRKRKFDLIFKREFLKDQKYESHIFPLPFGMNLDALNFVPRWEYKTQVSFWASESHAIRSRALEILSGKFDCDQNGTSKNLQMKTFALKGKAYAEALSQCKISISLRGGGWDTLRYWEIPALGPLMITQKLGILIPNDFEEGKHIAYCKDDLSDLVEICEYYLKHETERLNMVRAAYEHLKKFHTHRARAEFILSKLKV